MEYLESINQTIQADNELPEEVSEKLEQSIGITTPSQKQAQDEKQKRREELRQKLRGKLKQKQMMRATQTVRDEFVEDTLAPLGIDKNKARETLKDAKTRQLISEKGVNVGSSAFQELLAKLMKDAGTGKKNGPTDKGEIVKQSESNQ